MKKWIRYVPDRIDDGLRYLCGRMSPDVRLVCVVVMLTGFGCLSIYMTVSSIYRIGRHEGEQLQMDHIRRIELYRGINKDSINIKNQVDYGEPQKIRNGNRRTLQRLKRRKRKGKRRNRGRKRPDL